jgi:glycosyltransferase involved in cell wall biosynthesis
VICVSESLRRKAIYLGLVDAQRTVVLASGSCAGVDAERFAPTAEVLRRAAQLRHDLGIFPEAPVVGFVGRLTRDKGVSELIEAYLDLRTHFPELRLLLVGHMEKGDPLPSKIRRRIESEPGIIHTGFVRNPVLYYHVMDVVALPTYREGFGNTAIEANAAGKPVVAARSTGVVDAVIDGVTGILVPVGDVVALVRSLKRVLNDKDLAASMGRAGRERVLREFRRERVWGEMVKEYLTLLHEKGLWLPEKSTRASISNLVSDREAIGS